MRVCDTKKLLEFGLQKYECVIHIKKIKSNVKLLTIKDCTIDFNGFSHYYLAESQTLKQLICIELFGPAIISN